MLQACAGQPHHPCLAGHHWPGRTGRASLARTHRPGRTGRDAPVFWSQM